MAIDESLAVRVLEGSPTMSPTSNTETKPKDVIRDARENGIKIVDLRFTDLLGSWQHFSIPVGELTETLFSEGIGFDGSSIRGFQKIFESDMLLFPDPDRTFVDSTLEIPTLAIVCDIKDPLTLADYSRDPRYVARKAEEYLLSTGIADTSFWGPECEFYIFNSVRYDQNTHEGYYHIDSDEGIWNTGKNGTANLGYRPKLKSGYFPTPPVDKLQDLRSKIVLALIDAGVADRGPSPRGRHRRADRDRHAVRLAREDGRQGAHLQAHRQERLLPERLHGNVHAQAALR